MKSFIVIIIFVSIANAEWIVNEIPISKIPVFGIGIGDGRNDGKNRIYIVGENKILEVSYENGTWICETIPISMQGSRDIAIGDARNDSINRIYINNHYFARVYEFTYTASGWNELEVAQVPPGWDICIGRIRDGFSLFTSGYECRWNGTGWDTTKIPLAGINIDIGKGRNDGINRLYSFNNSVGIVEHTWDGSSYTITPMSGAPQHYGICVGKGRGDDTVRVYTIADGLTEYTYNNNQWSMTYQSTYKEGQWSLIIGKLKADGKERIYFRSCTTPDRIIEKSWNGSDWDTDTILKLDGVTKASLAIGYGRNDDTMRLYVARAGYTDLPAPILFEVTNTAPYVDTTGVEENLRHKKGEKIKVKVYPNPFVYRVTVGVELAVRENQLLEIRIYDLGGRLVEKFCVKPKNHKLITEMGRNLVPGIYFVKIKVGNKEIGNKKMTKIR